MAVSDKEITEIERLNAVYMSLDVERRPFMDLWRQVAECLEPVMPKWLKNKSDSHDVIRNRKLINASPLRSRRTAVNGMWSGMTNPASKWINLKQESGSSTTGSDPLIEGYISLYIDALEEYLQTSNFYKQMRRFYDEFLVYGVAAMGVFKSASNEENTVYETYDTGEYLIGLDAEGRPNAFGREFDMTVMKMVQKFGLENVSETVRDAYNDEQNKRMNEKRKVRHLIYENPYYNPRSPFNKNFKYREVYWDTAKHDGGSKEGSTEQGLLQEGGFKSFPIAYARWRESRGYSYSTESPGIQSIADIRRLQVIEKDGTMGLEQLVRPAMLADASLKEKQKTLIPGGITYIDGLMNQGAQAGFRPAFQANIPFNELNELIARTEHSIEANFFSDLFTLFTNITETHKTEREIANKERENLQQLGPVLRQIDAALETIIEETMRHMYEAGFVPPEVIEATESGELENNLKIEYVSILHMAQKQAELGAIDQMVIYASSLAQIDPSVLAAMDAPEILRQSAKILGVKPSVLRSEEETNALLQQQQQNAMAQQTAETAKPAADAAKTAAETAQLAQQIQQGAIP